MVYTAPKTWTNEPLTASDLNLYLRDNQEALKDPPFDHYISNEGSDYTTSSTTFVDVDADFSHTITTFGGDIFAIFCGTVAGSGSGIDVYFDVDVDGSRTAGDDGIGLVRVSPTIRNIVSICYPIVGLSDASHTFKLQWKVSSGAATMYAGAGTSAADTHPVFMVREIS